MAPKHDCHCWRGGTSSLLVWWFLPSPSPLAQHWAPKVLAPGRLVVPQQARGIWGGQNQVPGVQVWLCHLPPSSVKEVAWVSLCVTLEGVYTICWAEARSWLHQGVKEASHLGEASSLNGPASGPEFGLYHCSVYSLLLDQHPSCYENTFIYFIKHENGI